MKHLQLMQVPQVCEPSPFINHGEVDIQIPVLLLRAADHVHQLPHRLIDIPQLPSLLRAPAQQVARALDPFRNVRVPEEVVGHGPVRGRVRVAGVRLQPEGVVAAGVAEERELRAEGRGEGVAEAGEEAVRGEGCVVEGGLGVGHCEAGGGGRPVRGEAGLRWRGGFFISYIFIL